MKQEITDQQIKDLEGIARSFIKNQVAYMHRIVATKKYSRAAWLEQYEMKVKEGSSNRRIDTICKELGFTSRNLTEDEKAEVGFILLCDYLKGIYAEYIKAKSCVNSKYVYRNVSRQGEVLHLFYNPLTIEDLDSAYSVRRKYLASLGASYQSSLSNVGDDNVLASTLNEDIAANTKALQVLKRLYENLRDNWELKVDPLVPYLDDRKLKDLNVSNPILKSLAKKPESNLDSTSNNVSKKVLLLKSAAK